MKTTSRLPFLAGATLVAAILSAGVIAACDSSSGVHETPPGSDGGRADGSVSPGTDGGGTDGGTLPDGAPVDDCVKNPTTHLEIINACTDAARFDKSPKLPLLLADGGLPALP